MADVKCLDCDKNYIPIPDDSAYYTGPDIPGLGIKTNMSLKTYLTLMGRAVAATVSVASNGKTEIPSSDIITSPPPSFLMGNYSKCWDKVSNKTGVYTTRPDGVSLILEYDFQKAAKSFESNISLTRTEVFVSITENGVQKQYSSGSSAAGAFSILKVNFPVVISIKMYLNSLECNDMVLEKVLNIGSIPVDKLQFYFDIRGDDGLKIGQQQQFNQSNMNELILAKLSAVENYVNDLVASNYAGVVMGLKAQTEQILKASKEEKRYSIGTGINRAELTLQEVFQQIYKQISDINQKVEVIEEERRRASLLQ